MIQEKNMMIIICLLGGGFGIHRLIMGYKNWWLQFILTTFCGIGIIWVLIDLFRIIFDKMKMANGKSLI